MDRSNIIQARGERSKGTCEWILTLEKFKIWIENQKSSLLWIRGSPGKGKTYLSLFLAERLAHDTVLLEYYCDNKDAKRNTASAVIRGFMLRLLHQLPDLSKYLKMEILEKTGLLRDYLFAALWFIFDRMIQNAEKPVICVLDGLHECDETSINNLVRSFGKLFEQLPEKPCLKIALARRPLSKSNNTTLKVFPCISLDQTSEEGHWQGHTQSDVKTFVAAEFDKYFPQDVVADYIDDVSKREAWCFQTKDKLIELAEGTFLWAGFAMNQLKDLYVFDVEETLKSLPKGLHAMYDRILSQVKPMREKHIKLLLQWLVVAVRPMSPSELSVAIFIGQNEDRFRHDRLLKDIIEECKGLLIMTPEGVNLVHQSAKDYLLTLDDSHMPRNSFNIDEKLAHAEVARMCISYLQGGCLENGYKVESVQVPLTSFYTNRFVPAQTAAFPLLSYSVLYWMSHARLSEKDLFDKDSLFFSEESWARKAWLNAWCDLSENNEIRDHCANSASLLEVAAFFKFTYPCSAVTKRSQAENSW